MAQSTHFVRLVDITFDESLQPRCDGVDEAHIDALKETLGEWPPIVLARQGERLLLIDGFHRVAAAADLGAATISATIIEEITGFDAARAAFDYNATHGKALTLGDRKAYAYRLIEQDPQLSDREIGRRAGLNHETVGKLRSSEHRLTQTFSNATRKPGELESDIGLFDPIRRAQGATRAQKAVAGYLKRVATSLADPYDQDHNVEGWCDDPREIARACVAAMGPAKAETLLATLEGDASFIVAIAQSRDRNDRK